MNYVFIGLIIILLLAGATALVLGRQGINRTTLVFAGLVLVATAGFIYLAGRVSERERVWRERIRDTTAEINTTRYGKFAGKKFFIADGDAADDPNEITTELRRKILQLGGTLGTSKTIRSSIDIVVVNDLKKIPLRAKELNIEVVDQAAINDAIAQTLEGLNTAIVAKKREQTRLETWRNRNWKTGLFKPPKVERDTSKPGLYQVVEDGALQLTLSGKDADKPLNEGAELALFNLQTDDERGFLGVFSIQTVSDRKENVLSISILPLTTPDEHDINAWKGWGITSRAAENPQVAVYEDLPTSSKLPFDALTKLRGTEVKTADGSITSGGLEGMRRDILKELSTVGAMIDSIRVAKAATERERDRKIQTADALKTDRAAWEEDNQFAQNALEKLETRSSRLQKTLRDTRTRIFELRTELTELNGRLMAEGNREERAIQRSSAASGTPALR